MSTISLRTLIEEFDRGVVANFQNDGRVESIWFVITPDNLALPVPTPWRNADEKDMYVGIVVELAHAVGAVATVQISESWIVMLPKGTPPEEIERASAIPPSQNPHRKEMVHMIATDANGVTLMAWREIIREPRTKPRLGCLEFSDEIDSVSGRLIDPFKPTRH